MNVWWGLCACGGHRQAAASKNKSGAKNPAESVGSSGVFRILSTWIRLSLSSGIAPRLR